MAFNKIKTMFLALCATSLVGVPIIVKAQEKSGLYALSESDVFIPPRANQTSQPKGLSLNFLSDFKLSELDLPFIRAHTYEAPPALQNYAQDYTLTPHSYDTPNAVTAKSAYGDVRAQLLQAVQNIGNGVNNDAGTDAAKSELMALASNAFEAASVAYLSGFLERETKQTRILGEDAGSGEVFVHHVKNNLKSSTQDAAQSLVNKLITSLAAQDTTNEDVLGAQIDNLALASARSFIDAGLSTARRSDLYALRNLEFEYRLNGFKNSYFSILTTQPIYQTPDLRHSVFLQGGGIINERSVDVDDDEARHTFNIGAAYRYLTADEKHLFGSSIFFDHQWPYNHSRIGLGLDAKAKNLNFAANYYYPLTDYRDSRTDDNGNQYEERALEGYDIEVGYGLPFLNNMSVFAKGYQYFRETKDNLIGAELSAEYAINDNFTVKGAFIEENGGRDGVEIGLQYSTPLYDAKKPNLVLAQIETAAGDQSQRSRIFEKVRRENRIRVEEQLKVSDAVIVDISAQFNALSTGLPFDVGGTGTGAGINITADTPITVPNGDFGIINFSNGAIANISASGGGDVILEFNNTTLTVTATNGGFVQFISASGGISTVIVPGGTVNLIGTDIDVTDDGTTTTVQVRAGQIEVVPNVGVAVLNGNQADIVSLTIASGATSLLAGVPLETRQEAAFTNLDLINPDAPDIATAAPFINALPSLITGPQFVGNNADIQFVFSQAVNVTGAPLMNGSVDANARTFAYDAGASTPTQLVFRHAFIAGDVGAANITINDIDLNGGAITSTSNGLNAVIAFTDTTVPINDTTLPSLTSSTPTDNEPAFSSADNIVLNFNENIQIGTGNIVITDTTDGSDNRSITIGDAQVSIVGSTLTLNPTTNLELATDYDITIATGVIEDTTGNGFIGITSGNFDFTTSNDVTPPLLTSSSPADNDTEVTRTENLVLNFNEAVNAGAGNIVIRRTDNNTIVETIAAASANVTGAGSSTITINPTNDLPFGAEVYVLIDATAFGDLAGNSFAGISSTTALSFRTFSPLDVAGVVLWLDGQDVNANGSNPANGAAVSVWNDKGPNNTDISGTGAASYNTANEGVEFANTAQPFDDNYSRTGANNALSMFIVSTVGASGNSVLLETTTPRIAPGRIGALGSGTNLSNNRNWNTSPLSGKQLLSLEYRTDSSAVAYENATQTLNFPGAINLSASQRLVIGDDTTGGNRMISGEFMHSIIIFNADLSSTDRERIEGFLAHKWGTDALLPVAHPFKASPP